MCCWAQKIALGASLEDFQSICRSSSLKLTLCCLLVSTNAVAQSTDLNLLLSATESYHPELKSLRAGLKGTQEVLQEVRAAYRPSIFLEGNIRTSTRDATLQGGGDFNQNLSPRSISVRLNQTIYNGGRRRLQNYGAGLTVETEKARYETIESGIKIGVIQDYMALAATLVQLDKIGENVSVLRELKTATIARERLGDSSSIEVAQVNGRLAAVEAQLVTVKSQRNMMSHRLENSTGTKVTEAMAPHVDFDLSATTLEDIQHTVRERSPALRARDLEERSARVLLESESRSGLPTVALTAAAVASENNSPTIDEDNQLSVGVRFTMPLYSGGALSSQRRKAAASLQSARYNRQNDLRESDGQIAEIWENLIGLEAVYVSQRANLAAARQALKGVRAARRSGLSDTIDVLDAIEAKLSAELALSDALHEQISNKLLLKFFMGEFSDITNKGVQREPQVTDALKQDQTG